MKRKNYYQVHKNKTAKKIKKPIVNALRLSLYNIQLKGLIKNSIIVASEFSNLVDKQKAIVNNVINTAEEITNAVSNHIKTKYLRK